MAAYTFGTVAVYDPVTDTVSEDATGGVLVAVKDGPPIPIYDLNDTPISEITSNASGQSSQFKADVLTGLVQFGELCVTVWANEVGALALGAANAMSIASAAQASAGDAAAAAQSAVAQVAAYIAAGGGGAGGGLDETALDLILNDGDPTGPASRGLMATLVGFRTRALAGSPPTLSGAWPARPNRLFVVNMGVTPQPGDDPAGTFSILIEPASA